MRRNMTTEKAASITRKVIELVRKISLQYFTIDSIGFDD
jgi:hypothetical protein